jgi:alanyl-tRNA synthetase
MVLARSLDFTFNCGGLMKEALAALGLRGGGSPDLAQCEVPLEHLLTLRAAVIKALRKEAAAEPEHR